MLSFKEKIIIMCRFSLIISFWLLGICVLEASSYIKSTQSILNQLGYPAGSVDGVAGEKTYKAIKRFYTDENKIFDGKIDSNEVIDLREKMKQLGIKEKKTTNIPGYNLVKLTKNEENRLKFVNK